MSAATGSAGGFCSKVTESVVDVVVSGVLLEAPPTGCKLGRGPAGPSILAVHPRAASKHVADARLRFIEPGSPVENSVATSLDANGTTSCLGVAGRGE
jgi:hypothetical protein